jgi:hypothetical protein
MATNSVIDRWHAFLIELTTVVEFVDNSFREVWRSFNRNPSSYYCNPWIVVKDNYLK